MLQHVPALIFKKTASFYFHTMFSLFSKARNQADEEHDKSPFQKLDTNYAEEPHEDDHNAKADRDSPSFSSSRSLSGDNDLKTSKRQERERAAKEAKNFTRKRLLNLVLVSAIDIGLPLALYYAIRTVLDDVYALLISGIPPFLFVIIKFVYKRRVDILGCLVVVAYVVSAVISIISGRQEKFYALMHNIKLNYVFLFVKLGDARAVLLRDSCMTATIGLLFGLSLLPIRTPWFDVRPLTFLIGQQMYQDAAPQVWYDEHGVRHEMPIMDWLWDEVRGAGRYYHYFLSGGWSFFLFAEFVVRVVLTVATTIPVDMIYLSGTIMTVVVVVIMTTCTIAGSVRLRRIGSRWMDENDHSRHEDHVPSV